MTEKIKEILLIGTILLSVLFFVIRSIYVEQKTALTYNTSLISIQKLEAAILIFSSDTNVLPLSLEELVRNTKNNPLWQGPYAKSIDLISPDGYKYCYQQHNRSNDGGYYFTLGSEKSLCSQ